MKFARPNLRKILVLAVVSTCIVARAASVAPVAATPDTYLDASGKKTASTAPTTHGATPGSREATDNTLSGGVAPNGAVHFARHRGENDNDCRHQA